MDRRITTTALLAVAALVLTACPTGTQTPSAAPKAEIKTGNNITASLTPEASTGTKALTVTFGSVSAAGEVAVKSAATGPALPAGVTLTGATYYDVTTTAKFDKATLCFENDKVTSRSKLLHFSESKWNDRTTTVTPPKICGNFSSFSPVVIAEGTLASATPTATATPVATATLSPTPTATAAVTATPAATATEAAATPTSAPATPAAATAAPTTAATPAPPAATATPAPTVAPTPTPAPTPTQAAVPFAGYRFAANATGAVPAGFTRYGATVKDAASGAPIVGACVYTGPPVGCPRFGANTTDASGFFAVDLPSGSAFAFTIQSDPNNAIYAAILERRISAGTANQLTMTRK